MRLRPSPPPRARVPLQMPEKLERAFVSTAARVDAVKQRRQQLKAFKGGGGLFTATLSNLAAALASCVLRLDHTTEPR